VDNSSFYGYYSSLKSLLHWTIAINIWPALADRLSRDIPEQQFNTWISPLQCHEEPLHLRLMAPNAFVLDWVKKNYLSLLQGYLQDVPNQEATKITLEIGSLAKAIDQPVITSSTPASSSKPSL
jgi:chromosomal replication initiator protein